MAKTAGVIYKIRGTDSQWR